ncbi:MAG: sugar ABC transporter substrate-binding protein, partial [Lachnospiraceae bacterium]|nr:sugar ABC transporter substrate-binding protein [Lachnospiraceae bacterium]
DKKQLLKEVQMVGMSKKAMAAALSAMIGLTSAAGLPVTAMADESGYTTKELQVAIWDNNQLAGLQKIADEWSEKSGVKVQINVITWNEYWTLLEAGASGGELPDVFWMHINEAQKYMEAEMLLNLNDYIEADDAIDLANYYEGIVNIYRNNDVQYALPKDHDTIALLYNKAIFDKYGVDYPTDDWNWDDYCAAAAAISEAGRDDGVYGTAMNTNDGQDGWYNFIYDFGGRLISEDNKTSGMDDENTIKAMTYLADNLFPSMPAQDLMAVTDPDVMFLSGIVGMMLQGSWMVNTFYTAENAADYAWAEIPYYDANGNGSCDEGERCSLYNGLGWAAAHDTEDPKAAYDLISAFCCEEGQLKQSELGVTMAAYKGASDAFANAFEGMDISSFLKVEENGTLIQHPASRYTTAWEGGFTTGLIAGWQDPASMADVCVEMAAMMNEVLASE